jgi:hypothetical protein
VAILITASIAVGGLGHLLFVGFRWVKPESLRLRIWNWLEFEMPGFVGRLTGVTASGRRGS